MVYVILIKNVLFEEKGRPCLSGTEGCLDSVFTSDLNFYYQ